MDYLRIIINMNKYLYKSRGEVLVARILEQNNYDFFYEFKYRRIKPDFCIINKEGKRCFIEYNGRQHYIPIKYFGGLLGFAKQLLRDVYEIIMCIPLLRIKYSLTDSEIEKCILKFLNK